MSRKFGWCMTGHHKQCITAYTATKTTGVEHIECGCECHKKKED